MDGKRWLVALGGTALFSGVVLVGAFAVMSLSSGERLAVPAESAILMERSLPLKPFDEPAKPASGQTRVASVPQRVGMPSTAPAAAVPSEIAEPRSVDEEPAGGRDDQGRASAQGERPAAPLAGRLPRREPQRSVVAVATQPEPPPPPLRQTVQPPTVPAPVPRLRALPEKHTDGVLTRSEIRRIKLSLRLTRDQEPYWVPVEQLLNEIGAQQAVLVRSGQNPSDAFGTGAAMRMFSAARPLLDVLREDQKVQVRERARVMGFGSIASSI